MDIRQLKHLDALANTGSFTAAAKNSIWRNLRSVRVLNVLSNP